MSSKISKGKLNVIEALNILRNLPFDDELECDKEDCISEYSNLNTNSDDDDDDEDNANVNDISLPGSSRISNVLWRHIAHGKKRNMELAKESDHQKT